MKWMEFTKFIEPKRKVQGMKKVFSFISFGFLTVFAYGQSQPLEAFLDYKSFYAPGGKNMLEVYMQINAATVAFRPLPNKNLQSSVEITQVIKQGETIIDFKKNVLFSPEMVDSTIEDFKDQQRFILENGTYEMEISIKDLYALTEKTYTTTVPVTVKRNDKEICFSDIQLIESFKKAETTGNLTKSGYDLTPYVSTYFPADISKIAFYFEIYNSLTLGADEKFIVNQYIENSETSTQLSKFVKFTRQSVKEVVPILSYFDISGLGTGNYNLVVEVKNKNNEIISSKKIFFQRNNPIANVNMEDLVNVDIKATFVENMTNEDTLTEYIASLRPIASDVEKTMVDRLNKTKNDISIKKQFFYSFWAARSTDPENAWRLYNLAVIDAQRMFATQIKKGYETDRGITFLKYGAPDDVMDRPNEPSSYPYQIWHYHKLAQFNNKRFIFYLPDLVTNDYAMLHSDVLGEIKNYRWQQVLNSRNTPNSNVENSNAIPQWGGNSNEYFKNPR